MKRSIEEMLRGYRVADPGAPAPAAKDPVTDPPAPADGEGGGKWQRLFEKEQAARIDIEKRLKAIESASQTAAEKAAAEAAAAEAAKKTDSEKVAARLAELEGQVKAAQREALVHKLAAENKVKPDAYDLIAGDTPEAIKASIERLVMLGVTIDATTTIKPPVKVGDSTKPGTTGAPSIQEQITAAYKSGNNLEAIRLKRLEAGVGIEASLQGSATE